MTMSEPARRYQLPELNAAAPSRPPTAAELETVQARAYAEAWEKGHAAGVSAGRASIDEAVARLGAMTAALAAPLAVVDELMLGELRDLALAVGETLARQRLAQDPDALLSLIEESLRTLSPASGRVHVYLHPQDRAALPAEVSLPETVQWHDDPLLERGDLRVQRDDHALDGRLATRARELLRDWLDRSAA
jgi:flagellar assembly protein FliH